MAEPKTSLLKTSSLLRKTSFFFLVLVLFSGSVFADRAAAQDKFPELQGEFFSDNANLVDFSTRRQISQDMRRTLQDSKIHVVLALINQMSDYPELPQEMEKFTEAVAEHWELGESRSKQGILVLFSIKDRKYFVTKTKEMSERLTEDIKQGMQGLPVKALKQGNVPLAMKRAANVLVEMVPSFNSKNGAKNIVAANNSANKSTNNSARQNNANRNTQSRTTRRPPPTREIRQERRGGGGFGIGGIVCVGFAVVMIVAALAGVGMAAGRGFGGGGHYGGGGYYGGGGGGFLSGMLTGSLLGGMFGGSNHGWGSGYHHEEHHHHYDHGGGGYDGGGYDGGGGGGFDYTADTFGGGDFDGGSMGEW